RVDRVVRALLAKDSTHRPESLTTSVAGLAGDAALPIDHRRRRRVIQIAAGGLLLPVAAWFAFSRREPGVSQANTERSDVCVTSEPFAGAWDPAMRAGLSARFVAVSRPDVSAAWRDLAGELDEFTKRWSESRDRACKSED